MFSEEHVASGTAGARSWEGRTARAKREMRKTTYQRIQGKRYTYQIRYDHAGYEVSRNGQIKKIGLVPKTLDEPYLSRDEANDKGLFTAEVDIEGLIGMDE